MFVQLARLVIGGLEDGGASHSGLAGGDESVVLAGDAK